MLTKILFLLSLCANLLTAKPLPESFLNITTLPITYFLNQEVTLSPIPGVISYTKLVQCSSNTAGNPLILISIVQPSNVLFHNKQPCALLEVSRCPTSWSSGCIIATNYLYNNGIPKPFNNITIPYNESEQTLYMRLQSVNAEVSITLHVSYVSDVPITTSQFASSIFNSVVPGSNWMVFNQMTKTDEIETVGNTESIFYFVNFCQPAIIFNSYTVTVTVIGQLSTPLAAFDVAACSANTVTIEQCEVYNGGLPGISTQELAISSTFVQLNSQFVPMSEGIYVNVYGLGGEVDNANDFVLSIVLAASA